MGVQELNEWKWPLFEIDEIAEAIVSYDVTIGFNNTQLVLKSIDFHMKQSRRTFILIDFQGKFSKLEAVTSFSLTHAFKIIWTEGYCFVIERCCIASNCFSFKLIEMTEFLLFINNSARYYKNLAIYEHWDCNMVVKTQTYVHWTSEIHFTKKK